MSNASCGSHRSHAPQAQTNWNNITRKLETQNIFITMMIIIIMLIAAIIMIFTNVLCRYFSKMRTIIFCSAQSLAWDVQWWRKKGGQVWRLLSLFKWLYLVSFNIVQFCYARATACHQESTKKIIICTRNDDNIHEDCKINLIEIFSIEKTSTHIHTHFIILLNFRCHW